MELPFYFDYACPWAYLGSCRVESYFRDLGVSVDFRPVSLKILYEPPPDGSGRAKLGERKQRNYRGDLCHWAEMLGAEFADEQPKPRPDSSLLLQAALLTGDPHLFDRAEATLGAGAALADQYPAAVGHLLAVAHSWLAPPHEVAIVGKNANELAGVFWGRYRPDAVLARSSAAASVVPLLEGRIPHDGGALAYVCPRFTCAAPTGDAEVLRQQLR